MENSTVDVSSRGVVVVNERKPIQGIKLENPFTFKALQVFTGFGFGCGIGIGVGSPINLGALPMVGQVMSATKGATDAFSGVSRHVNGALRKMGAKNIELGVGCGVGFGHGFGVGLAVKPGVIQKMQTALIQVIMKMMTKLGISQNMTASSTALPLSLQSGISGVNQPLNSNPLGSITQFSPKPPDQSQSSQAYGSANPHSLNEAFAYKTSSTDSGFPRTEKVLTSFLQNPILREDRTDLNDMVGRLRSENDVLQMVLKHQQLIEKLVKENEKLRKILLEDLKIPSSKLESSYLNKNDSACASCIECRRKQRRR